jgi:hypothetical protein
MKVSAIFIMLLLMATPALAGEEKEEGWEFAVTPYLWMMSVSGDISAQGVTADFDMPFSDILKDLEMAAMGRVEAWNGKWGLTFDGLYSDLKSDASIDTPLGSHSGTIKVRIVLLDLGGGYRLADIPIGDPSGPEAIGFDLLGGARYGYNRNTIEGSGGYLDVVQKNDYWTPYIGGRCRIRADEMWLFVLRGDIGGFDTGDAPHFIGNLVGAVDMSISSVVSIDLAYRVLYINGAGLDASFHGPALGATFRF